MILRDQLKNVRPGDRVTVQIIDKETGIPITLATGETWQTDVFECCRSKTVVASEYDVRLNEYIVTVR